LHGGTWQDSAGKRNRKRTKEESKAGMNCRIIQKIFCDRRNKSAPAGVLTYVADVRLPFNQGDDP